MNSDHLSAPLSIGTAVTSFSTPCQNTNTPPCTSLSENWICMKCYKVFCGRYVHAHMLLHSDESGHLISTSLSDLMTWCYGCESYVMGALLKPSEQALHLAKFGSLPGENLAIQVNNENDGGSKEKAKEATEEVEDSIEDIEKGVERFAELLTNSTRCVFFTGAGISTSAKIPDFRGPEGVWTLKAKGLSAESVRLEQCQPTVSHMALVRLQKHFKEQGKDFYVVSQNIDGLHRRSGLKSEELSELHGNSFREDCWNCKRDFLRTFDSALESGRGGSHCAECKKRVPNFCHCTPRTCDSCGSVLKDSIIHFGENLPRDHLERAYTKSKSADLMVVLGSSLTVSPANDLPRKTVEGGGKLVLVNLQPTHQDSKADVRIFAKIDLVMKKVMEKLDLECPEFNLDSFFNDN